MNFKPLMSKREILKRKIWQEKVYSKLKDNSIKEVKILDKEITGLPEVFAPLWGDSILLAKVLKKEVRNRKIKNKFLELYLNRRFELKNPLQNYEPFRGSKNYNILAVKGEK